MTDRETIQRLNPAPNSIGLAWGLICAACSAAWFVVGLVIGTYFINPNSTEHRLNKLFVRHSRFIHQPDRGKLSLGLQINIKNLFVHFLVFRNVKPNCKRFILCLDRVPVRQLRRGNRLAPQRGQPPAQSV